MGLVVGSVSFGSAGYYVAGPVSRTLEPEFVMSESPFALAPTQLQQRLNAVMIWEFEADLQAADADALDDMLASLNAALTAKGNDVIDTLTGGTHVGTYYKFASPPIVPGRTAYMETRHVCRCNVILRTRPYAEGVLTALSLVDLVATHSPTGDTWPTTWYRSSDTIFTADAGEFKAASSDAPAGNEATYPLDSEDGFAVVPGCTYGVVCHAEVTAFTSGSANVGIAWYEADGTPLATTNLLSITAADGEHIFQGSGSAPTTSAFAKVKTYLSTGANLTMRWHGVDFGPGYLAGPGLLDLGVLSGDMPAPLEIALNRAWTADVGLATAVLAAAASGMDISDYRVMASGGSGWTAGTDAYFGSCKKTKSAMSVACEFTAPDAGRYRVWVRAMREVSNASIGLTADNSTTPYATVSIVSTGWRWYNLGEFEADGVRTLTITGSHNGTNYLWFNEVFLQPLAVSACSYADRDDVAALDLAWQSQTRDLIAGGSESASAYMQGRTILFPPAQRYLLVLVDDEAGETEDVVATLAISYRPRSWGRL